MQRMPKAALLVLLGDVQDGLWRADQVPHGRPYSRTLLAQTNLCALRPCLVTTLKMHQILCMA